VRKNSIGIAKQPIGTHDVTRRGQVLRSDSSPNLPVIALLADTVLSGQGLGEVAINFDRR